MTSKILDPPLRVAEGLTIRSIRTDRYVCLPSVVHSSQIVDCVGSGFRLLKIITIRTDRKEFSFLEWSLRIVYCRFNLKIHVCDYSYSMVCYLRRLERVFCCCSGCETIEDYKEGYLMVWADYMSPCNSIAGLYFEGACDAISVTIATHKVDENVH